MDQKQIKEHLKSARDFLKSKQFTEALHVCKDVLSADHDNYNAFVFQGASLVGLHQLTDALESYRQAVRLDPSQLLAWQGICSVYEKHSDEFKDLEKSELITCYEKLFNPSSTDKKNLELGVRLGEAYLSQGQYDMAVSTCKGLMQMETWNGANDITKHCVWKALSVALPLVKEGTDFDLLNRSCQAVINSNLTDSRDKAYCWEQFIRCSFDKTHDVNEMWKMCMESAHLVDMPIYQLEIMCQVYLDTIEVREKPYDVNYALETLGIIKPDSCWLKLIEGFKCFQDRALSAAEAQLSQGLKTTETAISGLYFEGRSLFALHRNQEAKSVIVKAMSLLDGNVMFFGSREKMRDMLKFYLAKALLDHPSSTEWEEGFKISQELCKLDSSNIDFKLCLGHAQLKLKAFDKAKQVVDEVSNYVPTVEILTFRGIYYFLLEKSDEAACSFLEATNLDSQCVLGHFYLGLIQLHKLQLGKTSDVKVKEQEEDLKQKCLKHLLQAAKLDPFFSDAFVSLGHFYHQILSDPFKARRCYHKGFELNNENQEAGAGLIDCMLALEEQESALNLLTTITEKNRGNSPKWVWVRLGLHQMKYGDPTDAIISFQTSIKQDPKNVHCWECLGDAFLNRGSYSSALKVFTKVTELSPDDLYGYYQVAAIKLKLGLYAEAVDQYQWILNKSPDYLPALQGFSETCLQEAHQALNHLLYFRASDCCQAALSHLTRAAKKRPEMCCIWKQLGDACTMLHVIPSQLFRINVPIELLSHSAAADGATEAVNKKELLALGARCYGMALKLQPHMASLWHDIGVNYYHQMKVNEKVLSKALAVKSLHAIRKAVTLDPTNCEHWSALGVVAASKELSESGLAQHCFIKSIETEPNNVVAWTNLGTLYLINNHIELAHKAFKVAQSLEPSYSSSWIGQAFIAESVGDYDTMDLFRHTTELTDNLESCIGYSHLVCLALKDSSKMASKCYQYAIENLNAVTAASDAMSKYTDCVPDNIVAWNLYGILLERQQLNRPALRMLEKALHLGMTSGVGNQDAILLALRENYARLLCKNGKYEEAVAQYQALDAEKSFDVACGLGLALLKVGQANLGIQMYEKALNLASDATDQSLVHVALGIASFMIQDTDGAKTHFFHSIKVTPSSANQEGLKALLGLALLQRNPTLMMSVLKTMHQMTNAISLSSDLTVFKAYIQLLLGNVRMATTELIKSIHLRPYMAENWTHLAKFLLMSQPDGHEKAKSCSHVAVMSDIQHHQVALQCLSLSSSLSPSINDCDAFRAAQKTVHLQPDASVNWCLLLAASHLENIRRMLINEPYLELQAFIISIAAHLVSQIELELSSSQLNKAALLLLRNWCAHQYPVALMFARKMELASKFLEQASWYYDDDPVISGLASYFGQDDALRKLAKDHPSPNIYQILLAWSFRSGSVADAHTCYKIWLKELSGSTSRGLALAVPVRTFITRCLLWMHVQAGNEAEIKELLAIAKASNDKEFLNIYTQEVASMKA